MILYLLFMFITNIYIYIYMDMVIYFSILFKKKKTKLFIIWVKVVTDVMNYIYSYLIVQFLGTFISISICFVSLSL